MPHVCGDEPAPKGYDLSELRMPHVCGDEPRMYLTCNPGGVYALRMWG